MNYTIEQKQAIRLRKKDVLVSAGAGAGKTRVLVDRIAGLILDRDHPVSVNEILVLTFTNAAAAQMKERILLKLEELREKDPDNYCLARQIRMVSHADISTVHSFCSRLLKTYFQEIGLDPSFRIGEEGELYLIRQKVMEELLEDRYAKADEEFLQLLESYIPEKNDGKLETMIEEMYEFSNNFPDREQWFDQRILDSEEYADKEKLYQTKLCSNLFERVKLLLQKCCILLSGAEECFGEDHEPARYYSLIQSDKKIVDELVKKGDFASLSEAVGKTEFVKKPRVTKAEKDWKDLDYVSDIHSQIKDLITKEISSLCFINESDILKENKEISRNIKVLFSLADEFGKRYFGKKKEQNLYDFSDLEHMTLSLLIEKYDEEGNPVPSGVALELQKKYKALFVDEYQDTNLIQEMIIEVLHKKEQNNLFVVGDVKQSIYRFRQARPDLFLSRYEKYSPETEREEVRIELRDNFRSCPDVLHYCNLVFRQWMKKSFGGIDYTKETELRPGAGGPMEKMRVPSEFLLLMEDESREQLDINYTDMEAEAFMIAKRIKELVKEGYEYKDMAILLRSAQGYGEVIADCLLMQNIPVICDTQTGYFSSREVTLILNYLSIIDNVFQDIPMASVLLSSIGGFTNEELAEIKVMVVREKRSQFYLYDLLKLYKEQGEKESIKLKINQFLEVLEEFRRKKKETPIHVLLWEIYQRTGYYYDLILQPEAERKKENLLMLMEKAQEYEKTVFKGLFYFVRYMEKLKTYEINLGKGGLENSQDNAVRVMTIHKSKGLEFPIVFVSRIHGKFNLMDLNKTVIYHPVFGAGIDYVDLENRITHPSFQKKAIREVLKKETLEEELRILYVAMTRAQSKLILTGFAKEDKLCEKIKSFHTYFHPEQAGSFLDWILAALVKYSPYKEHFFEALNITAQADGAGAKVGVVKGTEASDAQKLRIKLFRFAELPKPEKRINEKKILLEDYIEKSSKSGKEGDKEQIEKAFSYEYPYKESTKWKRKYSVSELKTLSMKALYIEEKPYMETLIEENEPMIPEFLREESEENVGAAKRGTIIHKVMERLPFAGINSEKDLFDAIEQLKDSYPPAREISPAKVYQYSKGFLFSEFGTKIRMLDKEGKVRKELPFTIGISSGILHSKGQEETIVVQGVIDLCCEEEAGLWLIDYKTDHVVPGEERVLLDRYQEQMLYYRIALEQITGKKVAKCHIYSFVLGKFIEVETGEVNA